MSAQFLKKANEIKVDFRDRERLFDYIDDYPTKSFVLSIPAGEKIEFSKLKAYNEKLNGKFYCELEDITNCEVFKENNIKFFWKYPVTNFYELQGLKDLGVSYVLIDAPIFFSLEKVKKFDIPIRVIPNVCYEGYIPREDGLHGSWIRPQDFDLYEPYISVYEFKAEHLRQIETLYHIYAENKDWVNNMNLLLTNFNLSVLATAIPPEVVETRLNCGQRCTENRCHLCERGVIFGQKVQEIKMSKLKEQN